MILNYSYFYCRQEPPRELNALTGTLCHLSTYRFFFEIIFITNNMNYYHTDTCLK